YHHVLSFLVLFMSVPTASRFTLSLHDALPIYPIGWEERATGLCLVGGNSVHSDELSTVGGCWNGGPLIKDAASTYSRIYGPVPQDRKSTRLNSSHVSISYAVFCLKKKKSTRAP